MACSFSLNNIRIVLSFFNDVIYPGINRNLYKNVPSHHSTIAPLIWNFVENEDSPKNVWSVRARFKQSLVIREFTVKIICNIKRSKCLSINTIFWHMEITSNVILNAFICATDTVIQALKIRRWSSKVLFLRETKQSTWCRRILTPPNDSHQVKQCKNRVIDFLF